MNQNPRHLGLLQKIYIFCNKYHISHDFADAEMILRNGLAHMALTNKIDSITDEGKDKQYVNVSIYFLGQHMSTGPFTPNQIKDIADIGSEIKFK